MVGTIAQMNNRTGGFSIVYKVDNNLEIKVPNGSKILCTNCEIENESELISNGSILKTSVGYDIQEDLDISITKENTIPLTILHGREILYVDSVISGSNTVFNLPKGARVNNVLVINTGEFFIPITSNYLIEY